MGQRDHVEGDPFDLQRHVDRTRPFRGEVLFRAPRFDIVEIGLRVALDQLFGAQAQLVSFRMRAGSSIPAPRGKQRGLLQQCGADRHGRRRRRSARGRGLAGR